MYEVLICLSNVEVNCMVNRIDLIKINVVNKSRCNIVLMFIVKIFRIIVGECVLINFCLWFFVYFWLLWVVVCMLGLFVGFLFFCKCMMVLFLKKGRGRFNWKFDK